MHVMWVDILLIYISRQAALPSLGFNCSFSMKVRVSFCRVSPPPHFCRQFGHLTKNNCLGLSVLSVQLIFLFPPYFGIWPAIAVFIYTVNVETKKDAQQKFAPVNIGLTTAHTPRLHATLATHLIVALWCPLAHRRTPPPLLLHNFENFITCLYYFLARFHSRHSVYHFRYSPLAQRSAYQLAVVSTPV